MHLPIITAWQAAAIAAVTPFSASMEMPQELGASIAVEPTQPQASKIAGRIMLTEPWGQSIDVGVFLRKQL